MPRQAMIRCECAFTYMNAVSGKNLTALCVDGTRCGCDQGLRRRTPQCHGRSAVPPDDSDMHLGRERPPKTRSGTVVGGWQRGSLTPQMLPSPLLTAAPAATRAAKSAALSTRAKLLIVRDIAMCDMRSRSRSPRVGQTKCAMDAGGPLLPSLWSPRFLFA